MKRYEIEFVALGLKFKIEKESESLHELSKYFDAYKDEPASVKSIKEILPKTDQAIKDAVENFFGKNV